MFNSLPFHSHIHSFINATMQNRPAASIARYTAAVAAHPCTSRGERADAAVLKAILLNESNYMFNT